MSDGCTVDGEDPKDLQQEIADGCGGAVRVKKDRISGENFCLFFIYNTSVTMLRFNSLAFLSSVSFSFGCLGDCGCVFELHFVDPRFFSFR